MVGFNPRCQASTLKASLWQAQPEGVARAVAIALFVAFLPVPVHMIVGAAACVALRANIPVMLVVIWINNPLTFIPILFVSYAAGQYVLGLERLSLSALPDAGSLRELLQDLNYASFVDIVVPLFVGSTLIGAALAAAGYILTHFLWNAVRARQNAGLSES